MASLTIKLFSLFALLLAVTATSTAFTEDIGQCQCAQMMAMGSLGSCRQYLLHSCGMTRYPMMQSYPMWMLQQQCCMQLQSMTPQCRCAAISEMVQYAQQELGGYYGCEGQMMRMAAQLPYMCNMAPGCRTCATPYVSAC